MKFTSAYRKTGVTVYHAFFQCIESGSSHKKKPRNLFQGYEHVQININQSKYSARSSLIQTLLSVLEFHQISRRSGSRTITAGRESQLMLITTTPKNFLLSVFDYTICKSSFQYSFLFLMNFFITVCAILTYFMQ